MRGQYHSGNCRQATFFDEQGYSAYLAWLRGRHYETCVNRSYGRSRTLCEGRHKGCREIEQALVARSARHADVVLEGRALKVY